MNKEASLREIETNYPIEKIRIGGESYWPFFRTLIYTEIHSGTIRVYKHSPLDAFVKFRNALLGIWSWTRNHAYLFFSNELERKRIEEGHYIDKLNDKAIEVLGAEQCLYVELIERNILKKHFTDQKK